MRRRKREKTVLGWREWIALPDLGVDRIKVKIDTGARTSALHAFRITPVTRDGVLYVRFFLHPVQDRRRPEIACEAPVIDDRVVVSSNGERQHRYVIETLARDRRRNPPHRNHLDQPGRDGIPHASSAAKALRKTLSWSIPGTLI